MGGPDPRPTQVRPRRPRAGHRGVHSIQQQCSDSEFTRIRIGIGKPPALIAPVDYVLQEFTDSEAESLQEVIQEIIHCIPVLFNDGPQIAMNEFHRSGE